jgi:hypothetical protein
MFKNGKELLLAIKDYFENDYPGDRDKDNVFAVLSALRGPDSGSGIASEAKLSSTQVIRRAVLGRWAGEPKAFQHPSLADATFSASHFANHISIAVQGLKNLGLWEAQEERYIEKQETRVIKFAD